MSTKSTSKLALDAIVPVEAPDTAATSAKKPYTVAVFGPVHTAMQQIAVLIRQGYTPSIDLPIEVFGAAGTISITLVLGDPEQAFVAVAAATVADAAAIEESRYLADVERAAARQIQAKADAEMAAKKAALINEQKRQLADLEKQIASLTAATAQ